MHIYLSKLSTIDNIITLATLKILNKTLLNIVFSQINIGYLR